MGAETGPDRWVLCVITAAGCRAPGGPGMSEYQYYEFLAVDRPLTAGRHLAGGLAGTRAERRSGR
jgi:hypothetical protein